MHYDVLVIGSGFGGSVTALRLTEKGYRVGVLEAGARFEDDDFPATSWDVKKFLFAPALGLLRHPAHRHGQGLHDPRRRGRRRRLAGLRQHALRAARRVLRRPAWAHITDWRAELAPYYDQAKRMLGVVENPLHTPADEVMQQVADEMGVGRHLPPDPGRRVLRRARRQAGRRGRRPVLRRRRTRARTAASTAASA